MGLIGQDQHCGALGDRKGHIANRHLNDTLCNMDHFQLRIDMGDTGKAFRSPEEDKIVFIIQDDRPFLEKCTDIA